MLIKNVYVCVRACMRVNFSYVYKLRAKTILSPIVVNDDGDDVDIYVACD